MITVLKELHPVARKQHTCMLCNCKIEKGQRYYRQTCVYDAVYDFIEHEECRAISIELDMYDDLDYDGLTDELFATDIDQYIYDNYPEKEADKLNAMSYYDRVCHVMKDLGKGYNDGK